MIARGMSVQYRTAAQIETMARELNRAVLGDQAASHRIKLDHLIDRIDEVVEDATFIISPDREMGGAEATTSHHAPEVFMAESVYHRLRRNDPRARFTAAHEVGHLVMHCRRPVYYNRASRVDRNRDPEWQADRFAAALLMPEAAFRTMRTVSQAMRAFGVSAAAAMRRSRNLRHRLIDDHPSQRKRATPMKRRP